MKFRAKLSEFRRAIKEVVRQITQDGVSQSKRAAHSYGNEEPTDYDVPGEGLPMKSLGEIDKSNKDEEDELGDEIEELEDDMGDEEVEDEVEEGITQTKRTRQRI